MNKLVADAKWKQVEALIKKKWAELTDNDLEAVKADLSLLGAKVQERYGGDKEKLEEQVKELLGDLKIL